MSAPDPSHWTRRFAANGAMLLGSLGLVVLLLEFALRTFPVLLPSGTYGSNQRLDETIPAPVYDGPVIYNKVRYVVREPNQRGFLDAEHAIEKPPGALRVGFFGDSYVEALQVPLDQTFARRLGDRLAGEWEVLAFGISGWGTLHSHLAYTQLAPEYDLDAVAYVFVENDPGDNLYSIQRHRGVGMLPRPFAERSSYPPGFLLRSVEGLVTTRPLLARLRGGVIGRSLLFRVVWNRLRLLLSEGASVAGGAARTDMAEVAGRVPTQNDLPSTWPASYTAEAREVGARLLALWRDRTQARGEEFFVVYVPRGERYLRGTLAESDTWKPWLRETCAALGIPLLDLEPPLRARLAEGESVYDDHWTPAGHEVVASVLHGHLASLPAPHRGNAGL